MLNRSISCHNMSYFIGIVYLYHRVKHTKILQLSGYSYWCLNSSGNNSKLVEISLSTPGIRRSFVRKVFSLYWYIYCGWQWKKVRFISEKASFKTTAVRAIQFKHISRPACKTVYSSLSLRTWWKQGCLWTGCYGIPQGAKLRLYSWQYWAT